MVTSVVARILLLTSSPRMEDSQRRLADLNTEERKDKMPDSIWLSRRNLGKDIKQGGPCVFYVTLCAASTRGSKQRWGSQPKFKVSDYLEFTEKGPQERRQQERTTLHMHFPLDFCRGLVSKNL